jgi:hypothetical protein
MAMESACKLQVGKDQYDGRVRMEADHIDFAGATKFRFRLSEIRNQRCEDDVILFSFHGNPVSIKLDGHRTTESWFDYIQHPQTLADKLGVEEGYTIRVVNLDDGELLNMLEERKTKVVTQPVKRCDMVMLGVERTSELTQLQDLSGTLRANGSIWVVLPKGGRHVSKAAVVAAVRAAGLNRTEVIDYSETQSAFRITVPSAAKKRDSSSNNRPSGSKSERAGSSTRRVSRRATARAR